MRRFKKIIISMLVLSFILISSNVSFADNNNFQQKDQGEIIPEVTKLGISAQLIFNNTSARNTVTAGILYDLCSSFNANSPLDGSNVLMPMTHGCWLGITQDNKLLVLIEQYSSDGELLAARVDTNKNAENIEYTIYGSNQGLSEKNLDNIVASLFDMEGVSDFYPIDSEGIVTGFGAMGINVTKK